MCNHIPVLVLNMENKVFFIIHNYRQNQPRVDKRETVTALDPTGNIIARPVLNFFGVSQQVSASGQATRDSKLIGCWAQNSNF